MYNNEAILPHWMDQFLEVASILGTENVFLSIFENGSMHSHSISMHHQLTTPQTAMIPPVIC